MFFTNYDKTLTLFVYNEDTFNATRPDHHRHENHPRTSLFVIRIIISSSNDIAIEMKRKNISLIIRLVQLSSYK